MDYSFLDVLLDSAIIIDSNKCAIYCNDVAAALCNSSVKRMTRGKPIYDFIQFSDTQLFTMPTGTKGQNEIYPLSEINYYLPNEENKSGKVQISIYPFSEQDKNLWIILIRDVTVENILHEKHKKQLEQLEQYSKNLEKMVEERTLELKKANNLLNAIMNSLGQGFLVFDEQGVCLDVYTKACEEVLEAKPAGKNIIKVLNCTDNDKEQFEMWLKAIFSEALPFESLKDLGPNEYKHSKGKFITLDFFALYNDDNKISNLVLVATDKTAEREANLALERERAYASMIIKFVTNRKLFSNFVHSLPQTIDYLRQQIESPTVDVNEVFRKIHTLEGEAASLSVMPILDGAKHLQEVITQVRNENNTDFSSVKDDYIFALQELTEAQLAFFKKNEDLLEMLNISHESEFIEVDPKKIKKFYNLFVQAGVDPKLNQQFLEEFTHISLRDELKSANLILEQIAKKQSKNVNPIHFSGEDIYVDHEHFKELLASLVHVFRNIIDHGIELPEERVDLGKPEAGNVTILLQKIEHNKTIKLIIKDDGRGVDPKIIMRKLKEKNPGKNWDALDEHNIIQEVFSPGFSSRDSAGEFSGRGVGMDAVKTEVLKLNGKIELFSEVGKGTTIEIELPDVASMALDKIA